MHLTVSYLAAISPLFLRVALAQSSLPQVDLGYEIHQAIELNVRCLKTAYNSFDLVDTNRKLHKLTTLPTSAMLSHQLENFDSLPLSHLRAGVQP